METGSNPAAQPVPSSSSVQIAIDIRDASFAKERSPQYVLSVSLGLHELNLCILDPEQNRYVALQSHSLPSVSKIDEAIPFWEAALDQADLAKGEFKSTSIGITDQRVTHVPSSLYQEHLKEAYYQFNFSGEESGGIFSDHLAILDAKAIYFVSTAISNFVQKRFPSGKLLHFSSALIEGLLFANKNNPNTKVAAHFRKDQLDVIAFQGTNLLFYNSFYFASKEDATYYLLYVLEQLNLSPETTEVEMYGSLDISSEVMELCRTYVRHFKPGVRPAGFGYSPSFSSVQEHRFFHLISQFLCA